MTSTLTHPRPTVHPVLIIATCVAAALVVVVLAFTASSSGKSDVDVRAPRIETRSATVGDATAANQSYWDRLQVLNTTGAGSSNADVQGPRVDSGETACGLTGRC